MVEWFAAGETQVANAPRLRGVPQSGSALDLGSIELVQADMRGFVRPEGSTAAFAGAERW